MCQGLCEKRAEAFIDYRTVHKVLRRAAEGGFPYLNRRCLEFCLIHLSEVNWMQTVGCIHCLDADCWMHPLCTLTLDASTLFSLVATYVSLVIEAGVYYR